MSEKVYEPGMKVLYDRRSKALTVAFRGRLVELGTFPTEAEAIAAGEEYCRQRGWTSRPEPGAGRSILNRNRRITP